MSDGKELNNEEQPQEAQQAGNTAGDAEVKASEVSSATQEASASDAGEAVPQEGTETETVAEAREKEASLAQMRLVEVDGKEGLSDAKRALGELEALLDEFEKPADAGDSASGARSERVTQSQVDSRLEEVAAAVTAATSGSKHNTSYTVVPAKGSKGGVVPLLLGVAALVLAVVALLQSSGAGDRLEALEQATPGAGGAGEEELARLQMEFRHLSERVNELVVAVSEGAPSPADQASIDAIETRLSQLEAHTGAQTALPEPAAAAPEAAATTQGEGSDVAPPPLGGHWVINLTSFSSETVADQEIERLHGLGIPVEKQRAVSGGKVWFRLRLTGLLTYEKAKAYIAELEKQIDTSSAWIASE